MQRPWSQVVLVFLVATGSLGCDKDGEPAGSDTTLGCDHEEWSPCEVEACRACGDLGGVQFRVMLSIPPIYGCYDPETKSVDGYDGYDYCELPYCEEEITILDSKTTPTSSGVTAGDVLRPAEGLHTVDLTWLPDGTVENIELGAEGTEALEIMVTHQTGELRFVTREEVVPETDGVPDIGSGADCHATIEADVNLQLVTDSGSLDEDLTVTLLRVVDSPTPSPSVVDFEVPWSDLDGTLAIDTTGPDTMVDSDVSFHTTFATNRIDGRLETGVEVRHPAVVGHTVLVVAGW